MIDKVAEDLGLLSNACERASETIEQLEKEMALKQAELEELEGQKAEPERLAANLRSFTELYGKLGPVDRQSLLKMMVKQVRLTPTRMELELYDHPTVIEDWDDGPEGWFRERLCWLPLSYELRNWMSSEECREMAAAI